MTGIRRATCDCCNLDLCGYHSAVGTPCSVVTSSECPSTLAVTFSFAGINMYSDCNYGVGSTDCQITNAIAAISETVITVAQNPSQRCTYTGSQSISGSWDTDPCTGSASTITYTSIDVTLSGSANLLSNAQLVSPCFGHGCTATRCAGVCAEIVINLDTGGTYQLSACWFSHCLDSCGTGVPCYNTYADVAPDQTRTWLIECTSPNHASACISGNGWSTNCSEANYARSEAEPVFSVEIS